ncbi:TPA: hypothetical protein R8G72_002400 [Citrobacter youngae]|uniref:Lipoprotein n=1 Tax=Salmonella enterica TaxID=28901 RepID=A0A744GWZ5_SALER|nr:MULTISPECIES: hypothetical protein [Enterobacteriaceae]EKL5341311.1 hypothetical protein [Salmonella enterica]HBM0089765.1 hypothetical protein [Salmonella enterica subsp. enterica serovar Tilburg]HEE0141933.1 hypothetical protein [Citrobacter youngae]EKR8719588.1 hypothetical protein [Salmonella enterica]MBJ9557973.1 hypothetical protein [Citrobacter sp. FDAARGOS_156]
MRKMLIAVLIIFPLASCTVHGNKSLTDENHQTVKLKIVKGKTTQQEILTAFGEPQTRATNDGQEMWNYSSMTGESQLSNYIPGAALLTNRSTAHIKSLDIWFKGDVVERYNFSQTASKVSHGLIE